MSTATLAHLQPIEQQALTEFAQQLQEQFKGLIRSTMLFGSKARGDSTPDSDLDVLIVVNSDDWRLHKQISYLTADICLKYDLELSPRIWSESHFREMAQIESSLYQNIRRGGVSLLEGNSEYSFAG